MSRGIGCEAAPCESRAPEECRPNDCAREIAAEILRGVLRIYCPGPDSAMCVVKIIWGDYFRIIKCYCLWKRGNVGGGGGGLSLFGRKIWSAQKRYFGDFLEMKNFEISEPVWPGMMNRPVDCWRFVCFVCRGPFYSIIICTYIWNILYFFHFSPKKKTMTIYFHMKIYDPFDVLVMVK